MSPDLPHQLILFGPPGTSKSYRAKHLKAGIVGVTGEHLVPIAFHPEYSYGEFVARLLPMTNADKKIEYTVHPGPFLRALARAYASLPAKPDQAGGNVVLLIDEINRGNCAEIFGDVFHLLDRDEDGWSGYEITVSDLVIGALRTLLDALAPGGYEARVAALIGNNQLKLPPNLYLLGTMNTSDESIFYMDSAFKRRWNFEFCAAAFDEVPAFQREAIVDGTPGLSWERFADELNRWILRACKAPKLDDKLVGPWFLKAREVPPPRLRDAYPADFDDLVKLAPKVGEQYTGLDNSVHFDEALETFANARATPLRDAIRAFARYAPTAPRKFAAIGTLVAPKSQRHFYVSKSAGLTLPPGTAFIEDFVQALGELPVGRDHSIPRADIVGKLFLYLWDNVFDRDKTPLETLIGVPRAELRTFGQFAALADVFIHNLMDKKA